MANINSVSSASYSSTSSLYGNRNVLTGLASGMDTESLIENSIIGYKNKIQSLQNQQTKLTWKQDAYRGITDKLYDFTQKYSSYSSKTNLSSNSFFTKAVNTTTNGKYKDRVSATGKSTSEIQINAVSQLATAARYSVDASTLNTQGLTASSRIDWGATKKVSDMTGSMTLTYGTRTIELDFGQLDAYGSAAELAAAIEGKLSEQSISTSTGDYVKANTRIGVNVSGNGTISFTDKSGAGNSVYISAVSGDLKNNAGLSITTGKKDDKEGRSFQVTDASKLSHKADMAEYLSGQTLDVTLDGTTKSVKIGTITGSTVAEREDSLLENINAGLKSAFGSKVTAKWETKLAEDGLPITDTEGNALRKLSFSTTSEGSNLKVSSGAGTELGIGKNGVSNYLNTSKTLGEMGVLQGLTAIKTEVATSKTEKDKVMYYDKDGALVDSDGYRIDEKGNRLYDLVLNGVSVGSFSKDTALESVIAAINNNAEAGVSASYSKMTDKFTFTARQTGEDSRIEFGEGLGKNLFGGDELNFSTDNPRMQFLTDVKGEKISGIDEATGIKYYITKMGNDFYRTQENGRPIKEFGNSPIDRADPEFADLFTKARKGYTVGQDAIAHVTVNGEDLTLKRSGNTIDMDGMSVSLKGAFNQDVFDEFGKVAADKLEEVKNSGDDVVTFTTKADADTIVDAIRSFVEDYNTIAKEVHDAYSTQPLEKNTSTHSRYEPLTEEDMDGMSESAIEAYEKKAKQGILFGDRDLSTMYSRLRSAITPGGNDRKAMESIGLTTTYSDGVTTLSLDEEKLRAALDNDPDTVKNVFAKTQEGGASSNGLVHNLRRTMDSYGSTSIATPGILVRKAGTTKSSLSLLNNSIQDQIDDLDDQIDRWTDKMSDKIDYYTNMYTRLEQLMQEMNSQSSALAGLMGY